MSVLRSSVFAGLLSTVSLIHVENMSLNSEFLILLTFLILVSC